MSLDFNLSKIKGYRKLCWIEPPEGTPGFMLNAKGRLMNPITHLLIFGTMSVDLGEITKENAPEFWARYKMCLLLWGDDTVSNWKDGDWKKRKINKADITSHIGLTTNVSNKTRHQWMARVVSYEMNKFAREVESDLPHDWDGDIPRAEHLAV